MPNKNTKEEWAEEIKVWEDQCGKLSHSQKGMLRYLLALSRQEILEKVKKADIADDKVGSFQDGYRCMKEQVLSLLSEKI